MAQLNVYSARIFLKQIFLQSRIRINANTQVIPSKEGYTCYDTARFMKQYFERRSGKQLPADFEDRFSQMGAGDIHICIIEMINIRATNIQAARELALEKAKSLIDFVSWHQDQSAQPFGIVVSGSPEGSTFTALPRLFVNDKLFLSEDIEKYSQYATEVAERDQKLGIYLSLYSDAIAEDNLDYRIVKLWSILETMAYEFTAIKFKEERVRRLLAKYEMYIEKHGEHDLITLVYQHRNAMVHEGTANPSQVSAKYKPWIELTAPIKTQITNELQELVNYLIHLYLISLN